MGQSIKTRVEFQKVERGYLSYREHPEEEFWDIPISHKAQKALRGAEKGDTVEVIFDYDTMPYSVSWAQRITGTPIGDVEQLTARVESLEEQLRIITQGIGLMSASVAPGLRWIDEKIVAAAKDREILEQSSKK